MNTFNESLLTDKSMSRSQIVLSPEAMQRKFFEMDLKMDSLLEGMKTLLNVRKVACDEPEDDDIVRDSKFKLPLNNIAELERLDNLLKMDRKVVRKLTSELAFCGKEGNFNKTVSNTLKHVIGPDLWSFYTFCGIESKAGETVVRKFKGLDVYQCIENAIRNRFPNETVTAIHGKCIEVFTKTRNQMKKAANK
ncbi:hypothetical protein DAPPUDRAFT_318790 [Daphnia pulex]|uniref:DUF4806 domain-containing protein n=1 Tax=Daphnia pulex TaxID=6669 RepID=E9GJP3_DAPPU|nr:hypothetical protein DAPPUDRAFT_318790 [Daphnia pulex]|eukprot:EFX80149.1 hypothetical protein DAPPUDRAFT_318790 [Daphnia pulex]